MTKKSRRVKRKGAQRRLSEAQLVQPTQAAIKEASLAQVATTSASAREAEPTDFQQEYQYVVSDLGRIGLLAAAMLSGLVLLSFLI